MFAERCGTSIMYIQNEVAAYKGHRKCALYYAHGHFHRIYNNKL